MNQRKSGDKESSASRKELETGSQSTNQNQDSCEWDWKWGWCLSKEWAEIHVVSKLDPTGPCFSHHLSDRRGPATVVQGDWGPQDPLHSAQLGSVIWVPGTPEHPGGLVLERMTVLWILALSGNYISIPLPVLFGNTYHKFNLVNSQAYFFFTCSI